MECPNCGAVIHVNKEGQTKCSHCGASFYAEKSGENIIVNTTINNYNSPSAYDYGHGYNNNNNTKKPSPVKRMLVLIIVLITIPAVLFRIGAIKKENMKKGGQGTHGTRGTNTGYRKTVSSKVMAAFCMLLFNKPLDKLTNEDYGKLKSFAILDNDEDTFSSNIKSIAYELTDNTTGIIDLSSEDLKDAGIDIYDMQCFPNLESIDFNNTTFLKRDFGSSADEGGLENLTKLTSFKADAYMSLGQLINLFGSSDTIKTLRINNTLIRNNYNYSDLVSAFPNLEELSLSPTNEIADLGALTSFKKLKRLETYMTADNSYLSAIPSLEELRIAGSDVYTDYSVVYGLTELKSLELVKAKGLKSIDFIRNMKNLERFSIEDSDIIDINILSEMTGLKDLKLVGNKKVGNYAVISSLGSLESLNLKTGNIEDSEKPDFSALKNLHNVEINANLLAAVSASQTIDTLHINDFNGVYEIDLALLGTMKNLKYFKITGESTSGELKNTPALSACQNLETIELYDIDCYTSDSEQTDLSDLINLQSIKKLVLKNIEIYCNPDDLVQNNHLEYLYISPANKIDTKEERNVGLGIMADSLKKLNALKSLTVKNGDLKDIDFVSGMPELEYLNITGGYVSDVSLLTENKKLKVFVCIDNPVVNTDLLDNVTVIN